MHERDIICLSMHYWDERRFRKQEFMSRFSKHNRVLFVEPSFSMIRHPERHQATAATNNWLTPTLEGRGERLSILKPPRALPLWTRNHVQNLNYRWFASLIARAAEELEFRDAVLWIYTTSYAPFMAAIPHKHLVFDLVDDLAAYQGENARRGAIVERHVRQIVDRADLLVTTAQTLEDRYKDVAAYSVLVPNGFDSSLFSPTRDLPAPAALASLPRPLLGFVGTIFSLLDFELLTGIARANRDKSIVMVGPVESTATSAFRTLETQPNVYHVGTQPQALIPSFVAQFDVCLNPFLKGPVADSVSPLKVYEYLAMGRPVVSAPMRSLASETAGAQVVFADGVSAFTDAINDCLSNSSDASVHERELTAAGYSWDRLFASLDSACDRALGASPRVPG